MTAPMTAIDVRRNALKAFFAGLSVSQSAFCKSAGVSEAAVRAFLKGETRSLNSATYEKLAREGGVSVAALLGAPSDEPFRPTPLATNARQPTEIPILGLARGGPDQDVFSAAPIDFDPMPPYLARVPGAYGLLVVGESMTPRYSPGTTLYIHPHAPPKAGAGVVILKHRQQSARTEGFPALVKEFVRQTLEEIFVREYHPHTRVFSIPRADVLAMHIIAGTREN